MYIKFFKVLKQHYELNTLSKDAINVIV